MVPHSVVNGKSRTMIRYARTGSQPNGSRYIIKNFAAVRVIIGPARKQNSFIDVGRTNLATNIFKMINDIYLAFELRSWFERFSGWTNDAINF